MSEVANIPQFRFPEFDKDWEKIIVGDIGKVSMCKRILKDQTSSIGDIPFYKIGTFGKEADAFISREIFEEFKAKYSYPKVGDILISASGTIGRTVVYDGSPAYFQDSNIVWIDNNKKMVTNEFLLYCYANTKWNTENTTIARLYNENLRNIPITIPSISEQQKIASFLSSVDKKIELLIQKHELLEKYKKGLMQKIFSQEIRFKQDDGSDFPDWENKSLSSLCNITTGKLDANAMKENGEYRFYTCAKDYYYIDNFAFDTEALLISGNGANVGYIHYYKGKFNAYQRTYILDKFSSDIIYTKYYLDRFLGNRIRIEAKAGNTPYIVLSTLSEMKIKVPEINEQQKIASFLCLVDKKIELVKHQIEKTQTFKKGLLQQMFV